MEGPLPTLDPQWVQRLAAIKLLALDVDGVLTEGRVQYTGGGEELQSFCVQDGQGLVLLKREGIAVTWITGRGCDATRRRAHELGIEELHVGAGKKRDVLAGVQERLSIAPAETAAMGDDLPDLGLAAGAGVFVAPANGRPEIIERADHVTTASGGRGAVRELVELLLRARGRWQAIVDAAGQ